MAFCPHCGKEAGNQASTCISCGKSLAAAAKPAGPVRFKGTMMMQPAANPPAPAAAAPAAPPAASPEAVAAPAAPAAPAAAPAGAPKHGFKGTMIGTGIPGVGAAAPAAAAPAAAAPAAAAPAAAAPAAAAPAPARSMEAASSFADTAPASDAGPAIAAAKAAAEAARQAAAALTPTTADDSARFLVGDPMAPHEEAARTAPVRHHAGHEEPDQRPPWMLVAIGFVGMLAIAGIGVGVAVYLGLLEL
jgi:hypothetical protein